MSQAQRELERHITAEVIALGARPITKGYDGAGHQTITFECHGQQHIFHYPCTTTMNGHARKNIVADLRRRVRAIPPPPPRPPEAAPPVSPSQIETRSVLPPPATPPRADRMTHEKRKEIAKRYLALPSVDALLEEYPMARAKLETLLLSQRGQAADKFKVERNKKRMEAARLLRGSTNTPPPPPPPAPKPVLTRAERDRRITQLYLTTTTTLKEIGKRFGISASNAWRIAHK